MNQSVKLPLYAKATLLIVGAYFSISMLSIGQDIFLPIIYATIFAIAISPGVNFLVNHKIHRLISIAIILLAAILFTALVLGLIVVQANAFSESLPQLFIKFQLLLKQLVSLAASYFGVGPEEVNQWMVDSKQDMLNHSRQTIGSTIGTIEFLLEATTLTTVYTCMILYYQPHLIKFVHQLFSSDYNNQISRMLVKTKTIIQAYLVGLFIEFGIVAVLNSLGLLLLGIDYAIMLGIIGALLNIIPFVGGIVGVALFVVFALLTKAPIYALYVVGLHMVIQFVDNHFIIPKIVGSKVKLNAHICLMAVIAGAALWGIPGMFLSIPLTAIVKLICDNIDSLKPWGFLLGDEENSTPKIKFNFAIQGFIRDLSTKK